MSEKKPWYSRLFEYVVGDDGEVDERKLGSYADLQERVKSAEAEVAGLRSVARKVIKEAKRERDEARLERDKYKAVLEQYADRSKWRPYGISRTVRAHQDAGRAAREALGLKEWNE